MSLVHTRIADFRDDLEELREFLVDFSGGLQKPATLSAQEALLDLGAIRDRLDQFLADVHAIDREISKPAIHTATGN